MTKNPTQAGPAAIVRAALSLLFTACAPELARPERAAPLRALDVAPALAQENVIDRRPAFALRFDRRLASPAQDSVWLLDGTPVDSLASDARRGELSTSNAARRIAITTAIDPTDGRSVIVEPVEPLWPGQSVTLVSTARLVTDDGLVVADDAVDPAPIVRAYRVCAAPDCRTLTHLAAPAREGVATGLRAVVVRFDRPVVPAVEGPVFWLTNERDGEEVPGVGSLACRDGRAWRCVRFVPDVELEAETVYRASLGVLVDGEGRGVTPESHTFRTGSERVARRPDFVPTPVCEPGELLRPPFCVSLRHGAITVRARSDWGSVLRVRGGEWLSESDVSRAPFAVLASDPLQSAGAHVPLIVTLLGEDGVVSREARIEPVVMPARVSRVRISEVYARPRSGSAQEFVELVNDDSASASLAQFALHTDSGASALPDVSLAPGARAVLAGPAYDVRGDERAGDPPLAPGAVFVRLERTLAQRGLADRGGDVWLTDRMGIEVSRAPTAHAARAPRVGASVVRADLALDERDPASWGYDAAGGATPGAPDRVR